MLGAVCGADLEILAVNRRPAGPCGVAVQLRAMACNSS